MPLNNDLEKFYPPCRKACPAEVNIQAYMALASQGKFTEALEVIRRYIPFPAVCGRICFSQCEEKCTRKDIDEALSIRAIKRLIADHELKKGKYKKPTPIRQRNREKVAIIGSGPAGLTAAYELVKMGYPVTVFEKASKPGGMLGNCIPAYRLPKEVVDVEIQYIAELGVKIRTNMALGRDITIEDLFIQGYKAIFVAIGTQKCLNLNVEGENLRDIIHSLEFLRSVNCGEYLKLGEKVAVIGGGNVAVDVARTAKRLGANQVTMVYRRSEKEMPAHHSEIAQAKQEGISFLFLASPKRFLGKDGKVNSIECIRMSLGQPDRTDRRSPVPVEDSEFTLPADTVILAIGEKPDTSFLPKQVEIAKNSTIVADPVTFETGMPGVFAGGDAVTGPASVIEAIAAGKKAAISIDRYIRGVNLKAVRETSILEAKCATDEEPPEKKPRLAMPSLALSQRFGNFHEVELGFDIASGMKEARRCMFCGPCAECLEFEDLCESDEALVDEDRCIACANCERVCPVGAIKVEKSVAKVNRKLCKGCGTCAVECPALAISMTNFTNDKILTLIKEARKTWRNDAPQVLAFVCDWSHNSNIKQLKKDTEAQIIQVKCAGRVDPLHILQAFTMGADGVLIVHCHSSDCHYVSGASIADKRMEETKKWLKVVGVKPERLRVAKTSACEERGIGVIISDFMADLEKMMAKSVLQKA